jgi:hypothetical protein
MSDSEQDIKDVIYDWIMEKCYVVDSESLQYVLDYKQGELEECLGATDEQLKAVSQWMEENEGEFDYFISGDNGLDEDLGSEIYNDMMDKV